MSKTVQKCPECGKLINILVERQPEPDGTISTSMYPTPFTLTSTSYYKPTKIVYKCANPKCWVTKVTTSWE